MRRALLAAMVLAALAACAPRPADDDPLTPIRELTPTNPLVMPQNQDPNGGAN